MSFRVRNRSARGLEFALFLVLASVLVGLIWILSDFGGAVGIARADDWSYLLTQFEFARTGQFVMNNWAVTMLIGQTLFAAPVVAIFGTNVAALQGFVAILSIAALVATYGVIRQVLPANWSLFSILTLAVSPVFGPSVVSFMTDIPALLFLSLSLLMGIWALRSSQIRWGPMIGSGLAGLTAFTFRDYAIVGFPAVILVGLVICRNRRDRVALAGLLALVIAMSYALYTWRHSLPNDLRLPGWELSYSIQLVARGTLTIALLISPGLAAIAWWRVTGSTTMRSVWIYGLSIVAAIGFLAIAGFELLGNVIHPFGTTWLVTGNGIRMWPLSINRLLILWAVLSLALLIVLLWHVLTQRSLRCGRIDGFMMWLNWDPARAILVIFPVLLLLAHSGATILLGTWYIDRYFILVIPFMTAATIRIAQDMELTVKRSQLLLPAAVLSALAVVGVHVVDFDARFDGARSQMGMQLVQQGYEASEIDAGMQWVSFHAQGIGVTTDGNQIRRGRNWWTERYPDQPICVTVRAIDSAETPPLDVESVLTVSTIFGRRYLLVAIPGPDSCE